MLKLLKLLLGASSPAKIPPPLSIEIPRPFKPRSYFGGNRYPKPKIKVDEAKEPTCPYCSQTLKKWPQRQSKCLHCKEVIYVAKHKENAFLATEGDQEAIFLFERKEMFLDFAKQHLNELIQSYECGAQFVIVHCAGRYCCNNCSDSEKKIGILEAIEQLLAKEKKCWCPVYYEAIYD